ncbi:hypothetical protein F4825DRAFT_115377 [Nemania diffusa]|nr:hypothetical protein F4825DRAFT_115377 [Nemania diffusa]
MAVSVTSNAITIGRVADIDDDSDYGSDFSVGEEQLVDEIMAELVSSRASAGSVGTTSTASHYYPGTTSARTTVTPTTTPTRTIAATTPTKERDNDGQSRTPFLAPAHARSRNPSAPVGSPVPTTQPVRVLPVSDNEDKDMHETVASASGQALHHLPSGEVRYPDLSSALSSLQSESESKSHRQQGEQEQQEQKPPVPMLEKQSEPEREPEPEPEARSKRAPDTRTPLQRFRSFPRRPLTVTDIATGAWCELQHWYTLTRLPGGKKTVTPAMRGGTRVHQTLEDEVHSAVQVSVASREEAFALRLWNIIQGARTLRDTGITRELEVWGIVEGEILNGVIDQLNHESPNASFEEELNLSGLSADSQQQLPITDYLSPNHKTVYLTDVKTRGSDRLPTGTALRPARVQLFLYHRLLSDMAADKLDYVAIFERYGLDGEARFSDAFIAQIGGLHDEIFYDADSDVEEIPSETYPADLIGYRSISQIIPLLKAELKETFPRGPASISNLLAIQYRHRDDGRILGNNSFPNDPEALEVYMKENLQWWRGERQPKGVTIEETYKCGWCEFAETCQWRKDKEAEFLRKKKRGRPSMNHASPTP